MRLCVIPAALKSALKYLLLLLVLGGQASVAQLPCNLLIWDAAQSTGYRYSNRLPRLPKKPRALIYFADGIGTPEKTLRSIDEVDRASKVHGESAFTYDFVDARGFRDVGALVESLRERQLPEKGGRADVVLFLGHSNAGCFAFSEHYSLRVPDFEKLDFQGQVVGIIGCLSACRYYPEISFRGSTDPERLALINSEVPLEKRTFENLLLKTGAREVIGTIETIDNLENDLFLLGFLGFGGGQDLKVFRSVSRVHSGEALPGDTIDDLPGLRQSGETHDRLRYVDAFLSHYKGGINPDWFFYRQLLAWAKDPACPDELLIRIFDYFYDHHPDVVDLYGARLPREKKALLFDHWLGTGYHTPSIVSFPQAIADYAGGDPDRLTRLANVIPVDAREHFLRHGSLYHLGTVALIPFIDVSESYGGRALDILKRLVNASSLSGSTLEERAKNAIQQARRDQSPFGVYDLPRSELEELERLIH